jgi:nitrate reductase assembly molybdenum cofactor insertion protein NarJ
MTSAIQHLEMLAALFSYPGPDYPEIVKNAVACAAPSAPALLELAQVVERTGLDELQEAYTNTFDLNPACPLDLGWHLFGEEYDRGLLLAYMRRQLRAHGIAECGEIPDHISYALLLLPRMKPAKAEEFACVIVAPALRRMLKCMPPENLFAGLLRAAQQLITAAYPAAFEPAAIAEGVAS